MKFLKTIPGQTLLVVAVIAVINALSFQYFFRIDMTEDQRYSISEETELILASLDEDVEIELFFDGSSSADYQQLYRAVTETIEEMEIDAQYGFNFSISNPNLITNDTVRQRRYQQLLSNGIKYIVLKTKVDGKDVEQAVFAGGMIHYKGRSYPINFIREGSYGKSVDFDQSVNEIEYEIVTALSVLKDDKHKRIAYTVGHEELNFQMNLISISKELYKYGDIGFLDLNTVPSIDSIDLIIIAQPKTAFSDQEKYKLDQYILKGGKVMFFLDELIIRTDTVSRDKLIGLPYEHNLRNLLRQYGIRLEGNIVQDYNSEYRIIVDNNDNQVPYKFPFYPLLEPASDHPIVEDLNPVMGLYVGTIDTVKATGVKRTPLLTTSKYSKVKGGDFIAYSMNELRMVQDEKYYIDGPQVTAYLCEGDFKSLYANRPKPSNVDTRGFVKTSQKPGQVIVVADGDMIRNEFDTRKNEPLDLGASLFRQDERYANSTFILNAANYLMGNAKVVNLKSKEIIPRQLDGFLYDDSNERFRYQVINLVVPIVIILALAMLRAFLRKQKYAK